MANTKNKNYTKEDLVWEAVRRNEHYKKYYLGWTENDLPERSSKYQGLEIFPLDNYWKLSRLYDPSICIDDFKEQIEKGTEPPDSHPYYRLFNRPETIPVIFHGVPGSKYYTYEPQTLDAFHESDNNKNILCIKKSQIIDRVVISIDPLASNKTLFAEIKEIKKDRLQALKAYDSDKNKRLAIVDEVKWNTKDDGPVPWRNRHIDFRCYERDIPSYFGWLKKYDEVINYCRREILNNPSSSEHQLIEEDGILTVTSNFIFKSMIPDDEVTGTEKDDNVVRILQSQYKNAVKLIKSAPCIAFSSSKKAPNQSK